MTAKVMDWVRQARLFLLDVQAEFKRVTWLDRKQTAAQTVLALIFVFFVAIYLGIVDLALSRFITYFLKFGL
ncbi:MAG: preprotein translocase subunit SecE [Candidatus Tectomicrobia bacterium RIFCSPLOWO2_02_FULL_70_19]|nr:MAG: preprotein translocase subunit SecE [Candidatus Tectomicrobia bacterium RIFCSPLOWO2_02_FULL_70_19]